MSEELEVLRVVVQRLNTAGVSHMLTGSVAMAWYAQPRQTRDISGTENVRRGAGRSGIPAADTGDGASAVSPETFT